MAETTRNTPTSTTQPAIDLTASARKWRTRFANTRTPIGATRVVEDAATIQGMLRTWPKFDHGDDEHTEALALRKSLSSTQSDEALRMKLLNVEEQTDRFVIIMAALEKGLPQERNALGVVADDRLEAVCIWQVLTGTGRVASEQDANFWDTSWKKALYVPELTGAPWNVGWPTPQKGVTGGGRALVNALKEKGRQEGCDGIALVGLACNIDFYPKVGFTLFKGHSFVMSLRT
ncbi:hypothetical protein [Actinophytocola sp.]|uniref:hypothetical protein n=1 Tax=Actinophytocola sp. TaxID=1872138 RepID=UPI003D6BB7C3